MHWETASWGSLFNKINIIINKNDSFINNINIALNYYRQPGWLKRLVCRVVRMKYPALPKKIKTIRLDQPAEAGGALKRTPQISGRLNNRSVFAKRLKSIGGSKRDPYLRGYILKI
jgi:hypothetical protein